MGGRFHPTNVDEEKADAAQGVSSRLDSVMRHWSQNGRQISKPLKVTFISFFTLIVLALVGQNLVSEYRNLERRLDATIEAAQAFLDHQKYTGLVELDKALANITASPLLINAFTRDSATSLQAIMTGLLPKMTELHGISEFSIYDPGLHQITHAHQTNMRSGNTASYLVRQAAEKKTVTRGLERGALGGMVISAVSPWRSNGRIIGFIKLSMDISEPLRFIGTALKANVVEVHAKESLPSGSEPAQAIEGWALTETAAYRQIGHFTLPGNIVSLVDGDVMQGSKMSRLFLDDRAVKIAHSFPFTMADGSQTSSLILLQDITPQVMAFARHIGISLLFAGILASITGYVFYRLTNGLQSSVLKTRNKLENEVKANTAALHDSRRQLVEAQKVASLGSWERDLINNKLFWSDEMYTITDQPRTLAPFDARSAFYTQIPADERGMVTREINQAIETCGNFNFEHRVVRQNGEVRHLHVRGYVLPNDDGVPVKMFGTTHDVTEHYKDRERSKWLADILESSLNEIYVINPENFTYEYVNQCARDNLGYTMPELSRLPAWEIICPDDHLQIKNALRPLTEGTTNLLTLEAIHRRKDGSSYPVEARIQRHTAGNKSLFVSICNDLSERTARELETEAAKQAAERMAYFDDLTELPNRAACQRDAKESFSEGDHDKPGFIIHLDIDNFKRINDTLGHSAGDACLKEAGERLRLCCTGLGKAYRWGGDEFVIIADPNVLDPEELCLRVNIVMRGPMEYEGHQIWPSVSMGVARCPGDGKDFNTLLVHADLALYRSKDNGKDRWSYFTSDMKLDSDEEARLEQELRQALRRDEFFLVFQPQVNIRTQQVTGIEALVRWQHPTRGTLGPGAFLPVVEKASLATPLSQVVIDKALKAARNWLDSRLEFGRIAVNLSPSHLISGTLIDDFNAAMRTHDVQPQYITAEVLESVFLDSGRGSNSQVLEELHDLGVHIELDDFGTGFASLSHVADLPINGLKIDRSFTEQILTDAKKEIVVSHLIQLARSLDINIVCEGVETDNQFDRLRLMGNFSVQGYYIARPMPFEAMCSWLNSAQSELSFGQV